MNDADRTLLAAFEARHAGKNDDELAQLAREELPPDLVTTITLEEVTRWALAELPESVVVTEEVADQIADGLVKLLCDFVRRGQSAQKAVDQIIDCHNEAQP
jgi:hypothetical protein